MLNKMKLFILSKMDVYYLSMYQYYINKVVKCNANGDYEGARHWLEKVNGYKEKRDELVQKMLRVVL